MLDKNRIATELKDYMSAPEVVSWLRVFEYVYEKILADVPKPPAGG